MSWLSDLKQEAETQRRAEPGAQANAAVACVEGVQGEMRALHAFITELAEQLSVLDPEVVHTYDLLGYTKLTGLRQSLYDATAETVDGLIHKVVLRYECVGTKSVQFWVENREECNKVKERLFEHGVSFRFKDDDHWRYVFTVQPLVKVEFAFEPHLTETGIRLVARNFERLGVNTYSFATSRVNEELLDELGKKVVGQANRFDELGGYRVAQDVRKQLQAKIAARQKEREAELLGPIRVKAAERLGQLFKKPEMAGGEAAPARPAAEAARERGEVRRALHAPKPARKYAWMVTGSTTHGEDTLEMVSRLGPGMEYHAGVKNLIAKGTHFRMLDASGNVRFTGYIVGECTGREPLEEYGAERDCAAIELELDGRWVRR